jgi:delta 1-pyrroline-5-carboxylate dehydrogenase
LVSVIAPVIAGGNTCVVLACESKPLCSVTFAEVLNSSDLPGGIVNILTGKLNELASWFVDHMDVNATIYCENNPDIQKMMKEKSAMNLKRIFFYNKVNWYIEEGQSPYFIMDTQEIKTTWHPVENIAGAGGGY